jgi:hypothetical protein
VKVDFPREALGGAMRLLKPGLDVSGAEKRLRVESRPAELLSFLLRAHVLYPRNSSSSVVLGDWHRRYTNIIPSLFVLKRNSHQTGMKVPA